MTVLVTYMNGSGFLWDGWTPIIKGYDVEGNEYLLELDLHKGVTYNWEVFKRKYVMLNSKSFHREFKKALREANRMSKTAR